ncbi:phosphatase PAP2 family protein [Streptomyces sp. NBC_00322]
MAGRGGRHGPVRQSQRTSRRPARHRLSGPRLHRFLRQPITRAFPSRHAASAAAFATAVTLESPWLGAALVPIAAGVAASRAHTDGHSPGEVLAGVAVGVGIAAATCRWWPLHLDEPAETARPDVCSARCTATGTARRPRRQPWPRLRSLSLRLQCCDTSTSRPQALAPEHGARTITTPDAYSIALRLAMPDATQFLDPIGRGPTPPRGLGRQGPCSPSRRSWRFQRPRRCRL